MDPHSVLLRAIEVVYYKAKEYPDIAVEFVFYFVLCSKIIILLTFQGLFFLLNTILNRI